jgi:hypothetical protein
MGKKKQCGLPCSCMRMVVSSLLLAISVHSPDKIVTFYNILSKNILNIANNLKLPASSCFKLLQNINLAQFSNIYYASNHTAFRETQGWFTMYVNCTYFCTLYSVHIIHASKHLIILVGTGTVPIPYRRTVRQRKRKKNKNCNKFHKYLRLFFPHNSEKMVFYKKLERALFNGTYFNSMGESFGLVKSSAVYLHGSTAV